MNTGIINNIQISQKKCRQSNFELLRIIAMLFIIASHFAVHGGMVFSTPSFNSIFVQILSLGGKIGVNLFVLITGYFGVTKTSFSVNKISKLIIQVSFYSVVLYSICCIIGAGIFGIRLFGEAALPMIFRSSDYWFFSVYLLLYLSAPFLNAAINRLGKRELCATILIFIFFFTIVPHFFGAINTVTSYGFSELIWFYVMYLVGAYIRLYNPLKSGVFKIVVALIASSLLFIAVNSAYIMFDGAAWSGTFGEILSDLLWNLKNSQMNNFFPLVISLLWFLLFQKINIGNLKILNLIGKSTFGIYLIHDNDYFRPVLWNKIFRLPEAVENRMLFLYAIFCIIVVFVCCSLIDIGVSFIFEKAVYSRKYWNTFMDRIDKKNRSRKDEPQGS